MRIVKFIPVLLMIASCGKETLFPYQKTPTPENRFFTNSYKMVELEQRSEVDIVWVIDNSGSMGPYQQSVIKNSAIFMEKFIKNESILWTLSLLSTDEAQSPFLGPFPKELDWRTKAPVETFKSAVSSLSIDGSGYEKSFKPVLRYLANANPLRAGALLAIIIVSDEEEQSEGVSPLFFNSLLVSQKRNNPKLLSTYMVGMAGSNLCTGDQNVAAVQPRYAEFMKISKGKTYSLTCPNYGESLAEISSDIVDKLNKPFVRLSEKPIVSTIEISFNGTRLPGGTKSEGGFWFYDEPNNSILFHDMSFTKDLESAEIQITFKSDDGWPNL